MRPRTAKRSTCTGPGCNRPARAAGLCASHYQQKLRGRALTALGAYFERAPKVRLPGLWVSRDCAEALTRTGPTRYEAAVNVLETWSARRGGRHE